MTQQPRPLLTRSDAQTIGWELAQHTPDNQLDIWQRLLYQLERGLLQTSECVSRLSAINEALFQLRPLPVDYLTLTTSVLPEETERLIQPGIQLGFDSLQRLQELLYRTADELGDHPASWPLFALWDAIDARNATIIRGMVFGKESSGDTDSAEH